MLARILATIILTFILFSCELFISKEEKSINLVQNTEVKFSPENVVAPIILELHKGQKITWLYYANVLSDEENCKKNNWVSRYKWNSKKNG